MQYQNRRRLLFLIATAFLILLIIVIFLVSRSSKPDVNNGVYHDPLSHETVTDTPGKSPESTGSTVDYPVFLGFDKLIDYGLTNTQLQELNQAFYNYSHKLPKPVEEVSIDVDHITSQHDPKVHKSPFVLLFKVRFDRKNDYNAKVSYTDIESLRLQLSTVDTNKTIYNSGVIRFQGL